MCLNRMLNAIPALQPNGALGGYSDYMVAPDEAIVTFYGNGYTSGMQVIQMTARRCAEVTPQHGYRYFVGTAASDASSNYSFTTPGYASTYGHGRDGSRIQALNPSFRDLRQNRQST